MEFYNHAWLGATNANESNKNRHGDGFGLL